MGTHRGVGGWRGKLDSGTAWTPDETPTRSQLCHCRGPATVIFGHSEVACSVSQVARHSGTHT